MLLDVFSLFLGFWAFLWRTAGGKREKVLSGKLEDVLWFPQQQELQEVREEATDLWMLSQVRGVVCLQLLLPQGGTDTHSCSDFKNETKY